MVEKNWDEMDGWEKAWDVTKVVGGVAIVISLVILPFLVPGRPVRPARIPKWKPEFYSPVGGPKGWKYS